MPFHADALRAQHEQASLARPYAGGDLLSSNELQIIWETGKR
jgi:hypothetical protein